MKKKSIEIGKNYPLPLTKQKTFKKFSNKKKFTNADNFAKKVVTLPLNPFLTKKDQDYISFLELKIQKNISIISTGPDRAHTIDRNNLLGNN